MGAFATALKEIVGGDPVKGIASIIDEFHASPEEKAQIQQQLQQLELKRVELEDARDQALAAVQGQNIRAETTSQDAYVRRARPTFLYCMIIAIFYSLVIVPTVSAMGGQGFKALEIPGAYLQLFGVGFLGYTGARTWEKVKGVNGS